MWISVAMSAALAQAVEPPVAFAPPDPDADLPTMVVVGEHARDVADATGSTAVVSEADLKRMAPVSTNEALALVPGIFVNVEDLAGLRQNIGIRGMLPDRSGKVTILEDGVPVTLAPYGEPALYVTPVVDRLRRIEVTKGSGSIQYGPQTVAGVIDYITHPAPKTLQWHVEGRGGTWGHAQGIASIGNTHGQVGYRVDVSHLDLQGDRAQDVSRTDVTGRLDLALDDQRSLVVKLQGYREDSRATYLGLTTPQFAADPSLVTAPHDRFVADRIGGMVRYEGTRRHWKVVSTLYGHQVSRDWLRQRFDRRDEGVPYDRTLGPDGTPCGADCPDDGSALFLEPGGRTRSRAFRVIGLETRTTFDANPGTNGHQLELGARAHLESIEERIFERAAVTQGTGDLGRAEDRTTTAGAAWGLLSLQSRDGVWTLRPGIRLEAMRFVNTRLRSAEGDLPEPAVAVEDLVVPLPGVGGKVEIAERVVLFAGVHRGFSPPRTRDTLDDEGNPVSLDAEVSVNSEVGLRLEGRSWIRAELAAFHLDFRRQVVPPTESTLSAGQEGVNSGQSTHLGAELGLWVDVGRAVGKDVAVPVHVSGTLLRARFGPGWAEGLRGNDLPYAPAVQLTAALGAWHPSGWGGQVRTQYVGTAFADRANTLRATPDGLLGLIPARAVADARIAWRHTPSGLSIGLTVKNLTDAVYVASRAPSGIQPGPRRHVLLSLASDEVRRKR
ncbi:MAG: TonB-dependent receptor [Myxococcota bacterium]